MSNFPLESPKDRLQKTVCTYKNGTLANNGRERLLRTYTLPHTYIGIAVTTYCIVDRSGRYLVNERT